MGTSTSSSATSNANRFLRGKGTARSKTRRKRLASISIFNTQAVSLVDLKNRGVLDMIFNNEGPRLGRPARKSRSRRQEGATDLAKWRQDEAWSAAVSICTTCGQTRWQPLHLRRLGPRRATAPVARFTLLPGRVSLRRAALERPGIDESDHAGQRSAARRIEGRRRRWGRIKEFCHRLTWRLSRNHVNNSNTATEGEHG